MAKHQTFRPGSSSESGSASAVAQKERPLSEATAGAGDRERPEQKAVPVPEAPRQGFFDLYKPGQGFYTRVWSGIALAALVVWFAKFLYDKLSTVGAGRVTEVIQVSVAVGVVFLFGLLGFWLLGKNRRACDFLIATEGEMKKVNWTTRKDIIGSTKVVIFVTIALAVMLFVVDLLFILFFNWIGVLEAGGMLQSIFGGGEG